MQSNRMLSEPEIREGLRAEKTISILLPSKYKFSVSRSVSHRRQSDTERCQTPTLTIPALELRALRSPSALFHLSNLFPPINGGVGKVFHPQTIFQM